MGEAHLAAGGIAVAPMMDCTDRHCRYFLRLISPRVRLYTEMITAAAIIRGDAARWLRFDAAEHPVAVQLGGSDPALLAAAARRAAAEGYDEINLNAGCPSERVSEGSFGACLMLSPGLVADAVVAMRGVTDLPVTVKTRIGVDDRDDYGFLRDFVGTVAAAGCSTFIIHARKAFLSGLSPKENRTVPPLRYDVVYRLRRDFPDLGLVINGGIDGEQGIRDHFAAGLDTETLARAPCLTFNRKDRLQDQWLQAQFGAAVPPPPRHWLPASQAFVDAALAGLGWGMNPAALVQGLVDQGRLVELHPGRPLHVALHWQHPRHAPPMLQRLSDAVLAAARAQLEPFLEETPAP